MLQWHNRNIPTLEAHYCQLGDLYRLKTEAFQFSSSFISQRTGVSFPTAPALLLLYAFTLNSIRRTLLFFLVVESSRCLLFFVLLRGEELYSIRWMIGRRKLLHGFQCHSLEIGTKRDRCRTTPLIFLKLGKIGNRTREMCLGRVSEMKRSSLPQPRPQP